MRWCSICHLCLISSLQFSYDSAYPKQNQTEDEIQAISCDADSYVLIWALRKPPTDDLIDTSDVEDELAANGSAKSGSKSKAASGWEKLKLQSALPASITTGRRYSPAVGRYEPLNKIWRPVHRIVFVDPFSKAPDGEEELFKTVITSLSVLDRPDLIVLNRKDSVDATEAGEEESDKKKSTSSKDASVDKSDKTVDKRKLSVVSNAEPKSPISPTSPKSPMSDKLGETEKERTESSKSPAESDSSKERRKSMVPRVDSNEEEDEEESSEEDDPDQMALPTFLMAGTIFGAVFRVNLSKVKVDVETNNLSEFFF